MITQETALNQCLRLLGEPPSTGVDDQSLWVQRSRNVYAESVQALVEGYPWNWCEAVVKLTPSAPTPIDWGYGFNLPLMCRRINAVSNFLTSGGRPGVDDCIEYRNRGNRIIANHDEIYLWYNDGEKELQAGQWSQVFADLVGAEMALRVYPVTDESDSTRDRIEKARLKARNLARAHDAQGNPPDTVSGGSWSGRGRFR